MCGIAGCIQRGPVDGVLAPMLKRLAHRGPDGAGEWTGRRGPWQVALGHRRLSIIDLALGAQPLGNEDGSVQITFNGEIYNFASLRPALERAGHRFATRSDTEVIVHQFEEGDLASFERLNGMFALALWDQARGRLVLARDRFGVKPLYYAALPDGGLAFASELTALLAHPGVGRALSLEGLRSYLFSDYAHAPTSLVRGVRKLAPGHCLAWEDGRLGEPAPFWRLRVGGGAPASERDLADELWQRLGAAVERQLVSDVPVGVFLSGGIDSATVATLARERYPGRLKTFSIAFEDRSFDESRHARGLARALGTEHVEERLSEANLLAIVDEALGHLDEPLADHSLLPTFLLARLAARHVKVVLGGDGGDELFGGYPTYRAQKLAPLFGLAPARARAALASLVERWPASDRYQGLDWKAKRFVGRFDEDPIRRQLRWMSAVDLPQLSRALRGPEAAPAALLHALPPTDDGANALLALDFTTYLPGSVLAKVDRAAMASSLEARPAFLDNELVDWVFGLPSRFKVRVGEGKRLLKRAAGGHLPESIVRRPKQGFSIPLAAWLRGPLRPALDEALAGSPLFQGPLSREVFALWAAQHQARRGDHAKALWALIVLDRWVRREAIDPMAA